MDETSEISKSKCLCIIFTVKQYNHVSIQRTEALVSADLAVNCIITGFLLGRVAVIVLFRVVVHVWGAVWGTQTHIMGDGSGISYTVILYIFHQQLFLSPFQGRWMTYMVILYAFYMQMKSGRPSAICVSHSDSFLMIFGGWNILLLFFCWSGW